MTNAPRVSCCDDPFLADRGFDAENHDWMVPYPKAFVIPSGISPGGKPLDFDDGQRSQSESNRLAQWLLDNGVALHRTTRDYVYGGKTIAKHSYVVYMDQFMRGFAYTSLAAGQDISDRITQLYAPPGAWSHGQLWGADTIEVPASATFAPKTEPITALNPEVGGVRGGGKADWYALSIRGTSEARAVLDLLRDDVDGEIAEASFSSASAGVMPAGSVLFANTPANLTALSAAGLEGGVWFERVLNAAKPATTQLDEAPQIAVLVNTATPAINDTMHSLQRIFGSDAAFVSTISGTNSLQNAGANPLDGIDVIYNTGQNFPGSVNIAAAPTGATQSGGTATIQTTATHNLGVGSTVTVAGVAVAGYNGTFTVTAVPAANRVSYEPGVSGLAASGGGTVTYTGARDRLNAFFADGGGYIGTSVSGTNFTFLTNAGLTDRVVHPGERRRGWRHRPLEQHRRVCQPGHRSEPCHRLLVPAVQRDLLLGHPRRGRDRWTLSDRCQRRPDRSDRAVRRRPLAIARLGGSRRRDRRARGRPWRHHRREPVHRLCNQPVLAGRLRAVLAAHRHRSTVVQPHRRAVTAAADTASRMSRPSSRLIRCPGDEA